jgi:predicted amidohydrolase YtcJ
LSRRVKTLASSALVGAAILLALMVARPWAAGSTRILTARSILTMEPDRPAAEAVGIRDGTILAVGSVPEVEQRLRELGVAPPPIDDRFAHKVLVPGFIDPHVHPSLAASILPMEIVSAMEWVTPRGTTVAVRGRDAFLARLRELDRERSDPDEWLLVWGYHRPYHGALSRTDLEAVSETRPILVWQRSVHEMFLNSRALEVAGLSEEARTRRPIGKRAICGKRRCSRSGGR